MCYNFIGNAKLTEEIFQIILNFKLSDSVTTTIYPDFNFEFVHGLGKLTCFNNLMVYEQIKTIKESIKMVHNKDSYFQNMLLNIFLDKRYKKTIHIYENIVYFKNILSTRIKKCTDFLRFYNININHVVYKLNNFN